MYLHFTYLRFPSLQIRTCVFHTCVFHPCEMRCFVLAFSVLAFSSTCVFSAPEIFRIAANSVIDRCLFYMEFRQCVQSYECITSGRVSPDFEHPYITASSNTIRTSPKHGTEDSLETDRRTDTKPLLYMLSAMDAVGTTNHSEIQQKSSILST